MRRITPPMEVSVPDVVFQKDSAVSSVCENDFSSKEDSASSQLCVDLKPSNRNKSPVTVQEWVDSLPPIAECGSR